MHKTQKKHMLKRTQVDQEVVTCLFVFFYCIVFKQLNFKCNKNQTRLKPDKKNIEKLYPGSPFT